MKSLLIAIILCFTLPFHDVQVATFTIYQESKELLFDITFEQDDIEKTFAERGKEYSPEAIKEYVSRNFVVKVNGRNSDLSYSKVESKARHIYLSGTLSSPKRKIKTLNISNTCLLNIEDHSNIIELRIGNQERDFLINSERKVIDVEL